MKIFKILTFAIVVKARNLFEGSAEDQRVYLFDFFTTEAPNEAQEDLENFYNTVDERFPQYIVEEE